MPPGTLPTPVTVETVIPLYHRVYTALRQQLLEGRHPPARPMPGEPQLARTFGVARVTVRRALQQLEAEGLVVRRASRGTFATSAASPAEARANISGLLENLVTVGRGTQARLLSYDTVPPPPEVAARLGAADVLRIVRVRMACAMPVAHYTHYLPPLTASVLRRQALKAHPVLSLLQEAGFPAASAEQALTARTAEAGIAEALEVPVGMALVCLKRLVRDEEGRPIEYHESLYRPDRYEYRLNLVRGGNPLAPAWVPLADTGRG